MANASTEDVWLELTSDVGRKTWAPDAGAVLLVTPDGIWPRGDAFIPAELFVRATVLQWQSLKHHWVGLALLLSSGATVCVPALARPSGREPGDRSISWRSSAHPEWTMLADADDRPPLQWSALNDEDVAARADRLIRSVLRPPAAAPPRKARRLGNLTGLPLGSGHAFAMRAFGSQRLLTWLPLPPLPAGRVAALALQIESLEDPPAWELGRPPVCFRDRVHRRRALRGQYLRFSDDALEFVVRRSVTRLPYERVDRIDAALNLAGKRQLAVIDTEGELFDLTGIAGGAYKNELQWWFGDEPAGEPHGSVAWPSYHDRPAITRLRSQLEAARAGLRAG